MSDLENLLHFKSTKPTTTKPSLNLEAQVVSTPLPAPIPEPGTWLIFGMIAGSAAWRTAFAPLTESGAKFIQAAGRCRAESLP